MQKIKRQLEEKILEKLLPNKVIMIFGARRVGKTVLVKRLKELLKGQVLYLNGEDYDVLAMLENRSVSNYRHLFQGVDVLLLDEAQHIPDIGAKLKLIVDEVDGISVIATGSSSFDLFNQAGEPLVGRSSTFELFPFSQQELLTVETVPDALRDLEDRLIYGLYPEVTGMNTGSEKADYLRDIVSVYLLKDILSVDGVKNAGKMKDLLRLVAFQLGNEVSYDEIGRQLGMSKNTVEKYLDLLSKVFIVYRLNAFSKNLRKEISKAGKWYFYDTGIRNAIISDFRSLSIRQDVGALWENYLISERMKQNAYHRFGKELYFWRTYDKQEIDLVEDDAGVLNAYEFKWKEKKIRAPLAWMNAYPNANFQIVSKNNFLEFILYPVK